MIESDKNFEVLAEVLQRELIERLAETHTQEFNLAKGRCTQRINRRLEKMPEHRRAIVHDRLQRLISRSYQDGEKEERIEVLIELVLDALEHDEYWTVCQDVQEAERLDIHHFAEALERFGLCDLAFMGHQATRRLEFLHYLHRLACDPKTAEMQMHRALQHNLWVLGTEYSLMSSNETLRSIVERFSAEHYHHSDAAHRPDLLLAGNVLRQHLLVEFKRPAVTVGWDDENQARKHAAALTGTLGFSCDILVVGGKVDPRLQEEYVGKRTKFVSYAAVITAARSQLEWLLDQLSAYPASESSGS